MLKLRINPIVAKDLKNKNHFAFQICVFRSQEAFTTGTVSEKE